MKITCMIDFKHGSDNSTRCLKGGGRCMKVKKRWKNVFSADSKKRWSGLRIQRKVLKRTKRRLGRGARKCVEQGGCLENAEWPTALMTGVEEAMGSAWGNLIPGLSQGLYFVEKSDGQKKKKKKWRQTVEPCCLRLWLLELEWYKEILE